MNLFKINLNFFIFLSIPLVFVIGNAAINLLTFGLFFFFINKFKFIKNLILNNQNFVYLFIIFFIYFLINGIILGDNSKSIYSALSLIKYPIFFCFVIYSLKNLKDQLNRIFIIWVIFFFFLEFDTLVQFFLGRNILNFPAEIIDVTNCSELFLYKIFNFQTCPTFMKINRLSGMFDSELVIGSFLTHFFIILYSFLKLSNQNKKSLYFLIITFFVILFSGERMSFILFLLSLLIYIFFTSGIKKTICIFACVFIFFGFYLKTSDNISKRYNEIYTIIKTYKKDTKSDLPYISIWRLAYDDFIENKFFGIGIKNFRNHCDSYNKKIVIHEKYGKNACTTHPHNFILEILAETGLVGFGLFFLLFYIIFKHICQKLKKNKYSPINLGNLCCFIILIFPLKTSGSIFSTFYGTLFIFLISLASNLDKNFFKER